MTEFVISGLVRKRSELAGDLERIKAELVHVDAMLKIFGCYDTSLIKTRRRNPRKPIFKAGKLTALVGEAERSGLVDNSTIAEWIITNGHAKPEAYKRVRDSV